MALGVPCFPSTPVHPDTGVPCYALLQSHWSEECSLRSILISLQCLLSEPEVEEGCILNLDAARLWKDAPHTYKQIALDCVVASLRIDGEWRQCSTTGRTVEFKCRV